MIEEGSKAPELGLPDQDNNIIKLSDFNDSIIVLYFYPKDNTPGCTLEGQDFTKLRKDFLKQNAVIIGVSNDDEKSHKRFIEKCSLNITLLSDTNKKVVNAYGTYKEKNFMGKKYMGIERTTFVIKGGKVVKTYNKVNPIGHAKEVLKFIKTL